MMLEITYKGEVKSEGQARRFFSMHQRVQKKIEKAFIPQIRKAIEDQFRSFIDAIHSRGFDYAKHNILSIVQFEGIAKVIKELYRKAAFIEASFVMNYIRDVKKKKHLKRHAVIDDPPSNLDASLSVSIDDLAPVIDQYFEIYLLNKSALPITDTTRKYISIHLVAEVDGGKNLEQAIADFTEVAVTGLKPKSLNRARKIALTESTRALSFGGLIGAYLSGVDVDKVWITCDDERVRGEPNYPAPYPHIDLDLNTAELFGSFYNGNRIKFPGDPDAHIKNTINCRCSLYFEEKEDPDNDLNRTIDSFLTEFFIGRHRS